MKTDKSNSYVKFSGTKPPGVIRIGCFGDSLTYGDEVSEGCDYPAQIQKIFSENGYENIEVINFGMPWSGFHQNYILWEEVGSKYQLDYVILGPVVYYDRDATFNPSILYGYRQFLPYLHSRYILKKGPGVKLIDPVGSTSRERAEAYLRYIPYARYLRYDREAPFFMISPVACLFAGKKVRNPFYYRKDIHKEMNRIYGILYDRISDKSTSDILLCHYDKEIISIGEKVKKDNFTAMPLDIPRYFPYKAPYGHYSVYGNEYIAHQIYASLTGAPAAGFGIIKTESLSPGSGIDEDAGVEKPLNECSDISIRIGGEIFGRFYECDPGTDEKEDTAKKSFPGVSVLIAFKDKHAGILESVFIPADFEIKDGTDILIRVSRNFSKKTAVLGKARAAAPGIGIVTADIGKDVYFYPYDGKNLEIGKLNRPAGIRIRKGDKLELIINGNTVFSGKALNDDLKAVFDLGDKKGILVAPGMDEKGRIRDIKYGSGEIYIAFDDSAGIRREIPAGVWKKEKMGTVSCHPSRMIKKTGR
ncbi:MAG: SGNH/GDSL hydrolase family protein [Elusimicrobia bacterium]|nr:SGNH/GDSL hydrolase family protein [Elusimicrobiota bacterium]